MKWSEALKQYNQGKSWVIPRKGTKEYDDVMAIMKANKDSQATTQAPEPTTPAPAKKEPKKKTTVVKNNAIEESLTHTKIDGKPAVVNQQFVSEADNLTKKRMKITVKSVVPDNDLSQQQVKARKAKSDV